MSKQTAVEFYRTELNALVSMKESKFKTEKEIFDQAKAMEREQIVKAHGIKTERDIKCGVDFWAFKNGEDYYNETYK